MSTLEPRHLAGLTFDWLVVRELRFVDDPAEANSRSLSQMEAELDIKTALSPEGRSCRCMVRVTLRPPTGGPGIPFQILTAAVEGQFSVAEGQTPTVNLEGFAKLQAPAILMPFVREAIAMLTRGSRFGSVLLPPINVVAVVEEMEKQRSEQPALVNEGKPAGSEPPP